MRSSLVERRELRMRRGAVGVWIRQTVVGKKVINNLVISSEGYFEPKRNEKKKITQPLCELVENWKINGC
ncbi:hypothetical protein chiPu_0025960 [Chiloscyllium punctatum]|uniref:Uncharacterized protein n=1 Tax=Chiloscyllium punctatum TaxID=137246 RepID=A0A401TGG2_CHIPU|nr:hypothetical protein [Chiloscyllium punctatum]